jgi:hypothetical protein
MNYCEIITKTTSQSVVYTKPFFIFDLPMLAAAGIEAQTREYWRGKHHCTVKHLFDWFWISCLTTDNFCFYLKNRLIQTSQTGGQWYSVTSPFSIPCPDHRMASQWFYQVPLCHDRYPKLETPPYIKKLTLLLYRHS